MNVLILTFDNLKYDSLTCHGNKNINSYVFDTFAKQSVCFHNFRLPTPCVDKNIKIFKGILKKTNKWDQLIKIENNFFEYELKKVIKKIVPKEEYFVWCSFNLRGQEVVKHDDCVLYMQEQLKKLIDVLDSEQRLEDTVIFLLGLGGEKVKHPNTIVFRNIKNNLYDESLHVPLMIFDPNRTAKDVANSVSLVPLVNTICKYLGSENIEENLFPLIEREGIVDTRWDIYSNYRNTYGIRGPMFQYFCRVKGKIVIDQELYDLNNDINMKNNLVPNLHEKGLQLVELVNVYKNRILSKL